MSERLFLAAAARFEAARRLEGLPHGHRARSLHGHSFLASVRAAPASAPQAALGRCLEPLNYALLNTHVATPTDENLARWIRSRLDAEGVHSVGVQSTAEQGVVLDAAQRVRGWRKFAFQAAHFLPNVPPGHKCARMHGHRFEVSIEAAADAAQLERLCAPLLSALDYACLNDIHGLENPTSELIARWIWNRLEPALAGLGRVTVYETGTCGARFDGTRYRIWKDFCIDSAVRRAPAAGGAGRGIHGHTYTLRLHLDAPLDAARGWTIDYAEVKERFAPVLARLDHQPLYELPGLEDNELASLLRWIRSSCREALPALSRIDLYESPGRGAILSWGEP
jgi:6-pyruvoyltetrahydropterin/6-carboxytetrahydropterin synthase